MAKESSHTARHRYPPTSSHVAQTTMNVGHDFDNRLQRADRQKTTGDVNHIHAGCVISAHEWRSSFGDLDVVHSAQPKRLFRVQPFRVSLEVCSRPGCRSTIVCREQQRRPNISSFRASHITSITINISEGATASGDGLKLGLDKVAPTGTGGSALQPYAEGYFSTPTNFIPTGSDGANPSQTTSDASITLQILNEAITSSNQASSPQSQSATAPVAGAGEKPGTATHRPVDISI